MGKTQKRNNNVSQKKRSPVRTSLKLRKEKKMKGGDPIITALVNAYWAVDKKGSNDFNKTTNEFNKDYINNLTDVTSDQYHTAYGNVKSVVNNTLNENIVISPFQYAIIKGRSDLIATVIKDVNTTNLKKAFYTQDSVDISNTDPYSLIFTQGYYLDSNKEIKRLIDGDDTVDKEKMQEILDLFNNNLMKGGNFDSIVENIKNSNFTDAVLKEIDDYIKAYSDLGINFKKFDTAIMNNIDTYNDNGNVANDMIVTTGKMTKFIDNLKDRTRKSLETIENLKEKANSDFFKEEDGEEEDGEEEDGDEEDSEVEDSEEPSEIVKKIKQQQTYINRFVTPLDNDTNPIKTVRNKIKIMVDKKIVNNKSLFDSLIAIFEAFPSKQIATPVTNTAPDATTALVATPDATTALVATPDATTALVATPDATTAPATNTAPVATSGIVANPDATTALVATPAPATNTALVATSGIVTNPDTTTNPDATTALVATSGFISSEIIDIVNKVNINHENRLPNVIINNQGNLEFEGLDESKPENESTISSTNDDRTTTIKNIKLSNEATTFQFVFYKTKDDEAIQTVSILLSIVDGKINVEADEASQSEAERERASASIDGSGDKTTSVDPADANKTPGGAPTQVLGFILAHEYELNFFIGSEKKFIYNITFEGEGDNEGSEDVNESDNEGSVNESSEIKDVNKDVNEDEDVSEDEDESYQPRNAISGEQERPSEDK